MRKKKKKKDEKVTIKAGGIGKNIIGPGGVKNVRTALWSKIVKKTQNE